MAHQSLEAGEAISRPRSEDRRELSFFPCGTTDIWVDNPLSQVMFLCTVGCLAASFCSTHNMSTALLPMSHSWQSKLTLVRTQSCPTLCNPVYCSLPGSSVYGIFQTRILEWVAISFSKYLSNPGMEPGSPALQKDSLQIEPPGRPPYIIVCVS